MAFVLFKGIEWRRVLTVTDETSGDGEDLTGRDVKVQLRRRTGEAVLIELEVGAGITLKAQSGDTIGQADVVIAAGASVGLDAVNHTIVVLVDDQVALAPLKLPVRAL